MFHNCCHQIPTLVPLFRPVRSKVVPAGTMRLDRVIVVHPDFPALTFAAPSAPEKEQDACRSSILAGLELGAVKACPDSMSKLNSKVDTADMVLES